MNVATKKTMKNTPGSLYESGGGRRDHTGRILGVGRGPEHGHDGGCDIGKKVGWKIVMMESQRIPHCSVSTQKSGDQPEPGGTPQCDGIVPVEEDG